VLTPVSLRKERQWQYQRWVRKNREYIDQQTQKQIAYIHIPKMNPSGYLNLVRDLFGPLGERKGLILDTRFNGGGWLHEPLIKLFTDQEYIQFTPRTRASGQIGNEPSFRWTKPVILLVSEGNYSDAHIFPYAFQYLGLGQVVGMPVAGTGTAVWWKRMQNPRLVLGIPQLGIQNMNNEFLENLQLVPDVRVPHHAPTLNQSTDPQIKMAIDLLLKQVGP
jgi:C-terminal processing protease CtpA/Prc